MTNEEKKIATRSIPTAEEFAISITHHRDGHWDTPQQAKAFKEDVIRLIEADREAIRAEERENARTSEKLGRMVIEECNKLVTLEAQRVVREIMAEFDLAPDGAWPKNIINRWAKAQGIQVEVE